MLTSWSSSRWKLPASIFRGLSGFALVGRSCEFQCLGAALPSPRFAAADVLTMLENCCSMVGWPNLLRHELLDVTNLSWNNVPCQSCHCHYRAMLVNQLQRCAFRHWWSKSWFILMLSSASFLMLLLHFQEPLSSVTCVTVSHWVTGFQISVNTAVFTQARPGRRPGWLGHLAAQYERKKMKGRLDVAGGVTDRPSETVDVPTVWGVSSMDVTTVWGDFNGC